MNAKVIKKYTPVFLVIVTIAFFSAFLEKNIKTKTITNTADQQISQPTPPVSGSPTPTPSPKPLTLAEMNNLYGPCTQVSVLMYHHVEDMALAIKNNRRWLDVTPATFNEQLMYLKNKNYQVIATKDLINFFNSDIPTPKKAVILTFDDGYIDFYTNAYPLLKQYNFPATVFLPTGLLNNPGYLTWEQINDMSKSNIISFANHTWSHRSTATNEADVVKEISTADIQLTEKGLDSEKVFAYPYGSDSKIAENYLNSINYNLAFTTHHGNIMCKKQKLSLPRIRIGDVPLNNFGF